MAETIYTHTTEAPEPVQTLDELLATLRNDAAEDIAYSPNDIRRLANQIESAVKREYAEAKAYFEKLHDGPSMVCTAKNCALRNAAEDIVEQVKAEASLGHFAPAVVEDRAVGNAAAMRDLLEKIRHEYGWGRIGCRTCVSSEADVERVSDLFEKQIDAALAAPARNCDRFATEDEAREAYWAYREPLEFNDKPFVAITEWLFAPAEGGAE